MREILGRRRRLLSKRNGGRPDQIGAALGFATGWRWPVLPGVGGAESGSTGCACPDPECPVPAAHPFDPGLLAATTDERMVRWWWTNRPTAPIVLATGAPGPCAVSLPAESAAGALAQLERGAVRLGPVVAAPDRWTFLVAPYSMARLGELLYAKDWVPGSLRFHSEGGYVVLPPSRTATGEVRWERGPGTDAGARGAGAPPAGEAPWLPQVESLVDVLVETLTRTGVSAPEF
ncbi:DNA primase [Streptomyces triticagri]|uniref:DNA primase n=1 Tax=Streptomyces triticagri TaxID=2293568 RepID=A0A372M7C1_9ACTN|nr:bifunctional DNA primase/polymerase [Streptomyces triticagri]RFU86858.1 DNA primase [Streptomyces triticagri]